MKLRNILLSSILINSAFSAGVYDQTTAPQTQLDIPMLCSALVFPSNTFGASSEPLGSCPVPDSDGDGVLDSVDKCPNTYGNQSDGCYVEPYTPVNLITSNQDDTQTNSTKVEEAESGDKKVNSATLENSDGSTSNITFEVPKKESLNRDKKLVIENRTNEESQAQTTILKSDEDSNILVKIDGSFEATREFEDSSKVGVSGDSLGNSKIYVEDKKESQKHSAKVLLGSFIKIDAKTQKAKAVGVILANDGESDKDIEIEIEAKSNERVEFIAKVGDKKYSIQTPNSADESEIELIEKESLNRATAETIVYSGVKSTFEVSKDFNVTLADGEEVVVESKSNWQRFEEVQYFEGNRTLKLLVGLANIGGEEMAKDIEYELKPQISNYENLDKLYSNFNLNLQKGWNLVANPIEDDINLSSRVENLEKIYKYKNDWIEDNSSLTQGEGVWLKLSTDEAIELKGDSYPLSLDNNLSSWSLIGVGDDVLDINSTDLANFETIWLFSTDSKEWIKNPTSIYRGYGVWVK